MKTRLDRRTLLRFTGTTALAYLALARPLLEDSGPARTIAIRWVCPVSRSVMAF